MIITCNKCHKKFNVDSSLIPEKGRLLQCNGCDNKWFFKKESSNDTISSIETNKSPGNLQTPINTEIPENINLLNKDIKKEDVFDEKTLNIETDNENLVEDLKPVHHKDKKSYNILGSVIVFVISGIALIILLDTLQSPISKIFPNIEFMLYNLYENIKYIILFIKDLI